MDPSRFRSSPAGRILRAPSGYWAFVPNPLPPPIKWTDSLAASLSRADRLLGELAGVGRTMANPNLLIVPFVRKEAVLSSAIEGTQASVSDIYAYEAEQLSFLERPADVKEAHNYVRAMERGLIRLASLPVSLRLIRELHADLMEGVRGERGTPGEFRRTQNWIGPPGCTLEKATYVPPPPEKLKEALAALEDYLHSARDQPALIRLALVHYQFEAIHPFLDGNGRVGRLLVALLLCEWGTLPQPLLYLSAFFEANRDRYYDLLLGVSQGGDWHAWLVFFLAAVESQSRDAMLRIDRLQALHREYRLKYQSGGPARMLQVIDHLFARPVLSVSQLCKLLEVQFPVASRYIKRLEQDGVIVEVTGKGRNRLFIARGIIQAIEDPVEEESSPVHKVAERARPRKAEGTVS